MRGGAGEVLGAVRETFPHRAEGVGARTGGVCFGVQVGMPHTALLRVPATERRGRISMWVPILAEQAVVNK
ncbi:hypothetical protein GCM10018782_21730 [Streptomyces griseoaurantiacus]|nr:hypothetical protein [Streptomyces sp. MH191]GHE46772.1 hypothetical protein GCM10018782_21730 [Streptomyces griseoaurantiacus]